ncbi:MAG: hypothetical protein CMJ05_00090 [Pelagibacterales bacterium]|nr:hypothetical protein [Pelagibacterales bacterium]
MILLLALFSPFLCLLIGLKNYQKNSSKYYVLVYILFYAFTVTFPSGEVNIDFFRRIDFFNYYASLTNFSITDLIGTLYSNDNNHQNADFLEHIMVFFVSIITDDYRWMVVVWGLFFGLFYVNNIWFIIEKINLRINHYNILWFMALFLIIPFWNINAFRFWAAAQIFIFGALRFFYSGNKKYLLISCLSIFAHFSFVLTVVLLFIYSLSPKKLFLANIIFLTTFLLSNINIHALDQIINYLPAGFQAKYIGYTSIDYLDRVNVFNNVDVNFYVKLRYNLLLVAFELMFLLIYLKYKDFLKNELNRNLFFLSFIILSFSNLVFDIKPLDRFFNIGCFFMIFIGLKFWKYLFERNQFPKIYRFISFLLIMFIVVEIRIGFDTISIASIIGNPITNIFLIDSNFSLIDLFK